ncbi:hypothetical protein [Streptomyces flavofungini]|uniref:hypothetical protein n=1 Tax=Streptomyces flavofungini TaxID=68200 RepID=UPI0025B1E2DD|nr:hypothetical protein [Streptomyces flavofungini]WJV48597.1 hypothetical protein QUY26_25625 [Streptomyces flavofungini]
MTSSSPPPPGETAGPSPGNRTETVFSAFLFVAFAGFLCLFVADARHNDALADIGRVLHWASGVGILATIALTRTALRSWRSGFDWIFAAVWIALTVLTWVNGDL